MEIMKVFCQMSVRNGDIRRDSQSRSLQGFTDTDIMTSYGRDMD